ncbi:hypothetical protein AAG906_025909 [Vitis piasezkii]
MIALEKPFRYALRLSLMVGFLVRHAIFEITYLQGIVDLFFVSRIYFDDDGISCILASF